MSDIRSMVREVLLEELGRLQAERGPNRRSEGVSIRNSQDLNAFALRVLDMSKQRDLASEIRSGRLRFELDGAPGGTGRRTAKEPAPVAATFDKGLITEKHIAGMDRGSRISVGKSVCFTPLAKDEIRRRGIKIERRSQ